MNRIVVANTIGIVGIAGGLAGFFYLLSKGYSKTNPIPADRPWDAVILVATIMLIIVAVFAVSYDPNDQSSVSE